ncbi:Auxin-induced protein aux22 [Ranunculus cassubicifolius]
MEKQDLGLEITELRLGLPGGPSKKRGYSETVVDDENSSNTDGKNDEQNKNQIVGWPPVRNSFKKKNDNIVGSEVSKCYVKVGMDGTPFMRKIDLKNHKGYPDLVFAFEKLFGCFCTGGKLKDAGSSEYTPIYEDKDGDWMLVGDVPWEMFMESCKRLRIMKHSDTKSFQLQSRLSEKICNGQGAKMDSQIEWTKITV